MRSDPIANRRITFAFLAAVLLVVLVFVTPLPQVAAQQRTAGDFLPDPATVGSAWAFAPPAGEGWEPPVELGDAAWSVYAGPNGARVLVAAWVYEPSPAEVRRAWQEGDGLFEAVAASIVLAPDDPAAVAYPPPPGCDDVRRAEGHDVVFGTQFPIGLTLCASDPDAVVFVATAGHVLGWSGSSAADAVASLATASAAGVVAARGGPSSCADLGPPSLLPAGDGLLDLLPGPDLGWNDAVVVEEGGMTESDIVAEIGSPAGALNLLGAWGWSGSAERALCVEPGPGEGGPLVMAWQVHRFADTAAAAAAMDRFADAARFGAGLEPVAAEPVADEARAFLPVPDGNWTVFLARSGPLLYRAAFSVRTGADPTTDAMNAATIVHVQLERNAAWGLVAAPAPPSFPIATPVAVPTAAEQG